MRKIFILFLSLLFVVSCEEDNIQMEGESNNSRPLSACYVEEVVNVRLQELIVRQINNRKNELQIPTGCNVLDDYLATIGAYKLRRVFPYAGKYESRQVLEGLNSWYTVWCRVDKSKPPTRFGLNENNIIKETDPILTPIIDEYEIIEVGNISTRGVSESPFNDPYFNRQWNLYNSGDIGNYETDDGTKIFSSKKGADVNVLPAWHEETGDPNVVIAIVDGGIDFNHEDLKGSLWINEGEIANNGIDDDNNGYIDDIYGYNFVTDTGIIEPHDHGTHVAGIIAAKNNNAKGGCGIAGGDGAPQSGVRLMSCQIFMKNPDFNPNDPNSKRDIGTGSVDQTAAAIVYGANNGAVISQNSWGYQKYTLGTPKVVKEAISYFIKYAGKINKKKSENLPMQGGLVVFAAANDKTQLKIYPASEPQVVAVAAHAPDFAASWYTNYGEWVNVSAPGGSSPFERKYAYENNEMTSGIYSTITSKKGVSRYGYMQGTSMACPHVSAIAGLLVSKYGKEGFTCEELKKRLLTGIKQVDINRVNKDKYYGKLGRGFIDAFIALSDFDEHEAPSRPVFVCEEIKQDYTSCVVAWKSSITQNLDPTIHRYVLYYSEEEITLSNYLNDKVKKIEVMNNTPIGKWKVKNLECGTNYYFAVHSFSRYGNSSDLVIYDRAVATLPNTAPTISTKSNLSNPFVLAGNDVTHIVFEIKDKENHAWSYSLSNSYAAVSERKQDSIALRFFANRLPIGENRFVLTVTDQYNYSSNAEIIIDVIENKPPMLLHSIQSINIPLNSKKIIPLADIVSDEDMASLKYDSEELSSDNVTVSILNDNLIIRAKKKGESKFVFSATDVHNQKTTFTLPLFVFDNEGIYKLSPAVVSQVLYVKIGDIIDGRFELKVRNVVGKLAFEKIFHTDKINEQKRTLSINVGRLFPGKYELSISNRGKMYKENFIKK